MAAYAKILCLVTSFVKSDALTDTSKWVGAEYTPAAAPGNSLWWNWFDNYEASVVRELSMAKAQLGITSVRMFLHSMVYFADPPRLMRNMDKFLAIAQRNNITAGFVFFGDCFNHKGASLTKECTPVKGRHNGCWMASPQDVERTSIDRFQPYVQDIVSRFKNDPRVLWWEVFNEPSSASYSISLRSAGYAWAKSIKPKQPVLSCWDDNNATDIVDHHDYGTNFKSHWKPSIYLSPAKGAFVTEAGSRWYQPPYSSDQGSPLTVINFLEALKKDTSAPYIPGMMINWEVMVGNSNTRWHWSTKDGTAEPAIPWDAWLFPDGTPVSFTEAAALRRYISGHDEFLSFADFLPHAVQDGDAYLSLAAGQTWHADVKGGAMADALVEATFWHEQPESTFSLILRTKNATDTRQAPPLACKDAQTVMNSTDISGTTGYTNFKTGKDALSACQQACCDLPSCNAWVVRAMAENEHDQNCTAGETCCWLKSIAGGKQPRSGTTSSYVSRKPTPPRSHGLDGYFVVINRSTITVEKREGNQKHVFGSFNISRLENGIVPQAWNIIRVLIVGQQIDVWFNPMYPETGFTGVPAADATQIPRKLPPRLSVRDPQIAGSGGVAVAADGFASRVDYIAALPPSALVKPAESVSLFL